MRNLVARISDRAAAAVMTPGTKAFEAAVEGFVLALQTVPDYPAAELSNEGFARVNRPAEQVIA